MLEGESASDQADIEWSTRPPDGVLTYCGLHEFDGRYYKCNVKNHDETCQDFTAHSTDTVPQPCASCRHHRPPLAHPLQVLEDLLRSRGSSNDPAGRLLEELRATVATQVEDEYQECVATAGFLTRRPASLPVCMVRTSVDAVTRQPRHLVAPVVNAAEQCDQWSAGTNTADVADAERLDALLAQAESLDAAGTTAIQRGSRVEQQLAAQAAAAVAAECLTQLGASPGQIASTCEQVTQLYGHAWDPALITSGQFTETTRQLQESDRSGHKTRQARRSREAESLRRAQKRSDHVDDIFDEVQKGEQGMYGSGGGASTLSSVQEIGAPFLVQTAWLYAHPHEAVAFFVAPPQLRIFKGTSVTAPGAWPPTTPRLSENAFGGVKSDDMLGIWTFLGWNSGWTPIYWNPGGAALYSVPLPLQLNVEGAQVTIDGATVHARWGTSVPSVPNVAELPRQTSAEDAYSLGWTLEQKADYAAAEGWYRQAADRGHTLAAILLGRLAAQRDFDEALKWWLWADSEGDLRAAGYIAWQHMDGPLRDLHEALRWYQRAATSEDPAIRAHGEQGVQAVQAQLPHSKSLPAALVGASDEEDLEPLSSTSAAAAAQAPALPQRVSGSSIDQALANIAEMKQTLLARASPSDPVKKRKSKPVKTQKSEPVKKRKSEPVMKRKSDPAGTAGAHARGGYDGWLGAGNVGDISAYLAWLRRSKS